jgi:outer membrane biosynthesis protein TonB
MMLRDPRFVHHVKVVASIHVLILTVVLIMPAVNCVRREKRTIIPVDFMVVAPPGASGLQAVPEPRPTPDAPANIPSLAPKTKPADSDAAPKQEVKVSRKRVVRASPDGGAGRPALSDEEIRRRLALAARVGDRNTGVPDADTRALVRVRDALYAVWDQPSAAEAGGKVADIELTFSPDGTIDGRRLVAASGSGALDVSAMNAAKSVRRIDGLTQAFLERMNHRVTVSFRVEP